MKQKMYRIISVVLACLMLAGCAAAPAAESEKPATQAEPSTQQQTQEPVQQPTETPAQEKALPQVGDELSGFVVEEIIPMNVLSATGVRFTHSKSGAELLYLATEDTNRSFDIAFRTPALDDKGKPHVFEHITICGSQKYPDANLFFPIINQTYNTFINALTYHGMTTYPVASLSEEQLMTMMDYYLSGVFMPLLYTEPKLAQREAWRYELLDADAELNIAGTVYSEMQGALTLSSQAIENNMETLYENSATAHLSGGVPAHIRTLSYEELIDFHDAYYHPSNALITLYGDLDVARFLEFIDSEYLSAFDKKDIQVEMGEVAPYTQTKYAEYEVPVEKDANTENASEIYYSFALNGADMYDTVALMGLSELLLLESSPVISAIREKLPHASIGGGMSFDSPSAPYLAFSAAGVDPEDRDTFVAAVDEGLEKLCGEGISKDAFDSVLAKNKLALLTTAEDADLGISASLSIALSWVYFENVEYYNVTEKVLDEMTVEKAQALIERYLANNAHRAVSVTKPVAGLAEKNAAALKEELAKTKAALSAEEVEALVKSSNEFIQWSATPASKEVVSKIANMEVADLPEEWRQYEVKEETKDGVRYLSAAADVNGVYKGSILLDAAAIPVEQLQDAQLYMLLLGELDTKKHSKEELSNLITRYLSGLSTTLTAQRGMTDEEGYYAADVSWIGLREDVTASMALLKELLFETDLSDTADIQSLLKRRSTDFAAGVDADPLTLQSSRTAAMFSDHGAYNEYLNGYAFYAYVQELIALADADPAMLRARLEAARDLLLNKTDAIVLCAGDEATIEAYQSEAASVLADMRAQKREKVDYSSLRIPKRNEGIVNNSTVQMNVLYSNRAGSVGKEHIISMLIDDSYLLPQLRNALGAYGAYSNMDLESAHLYTYRDPNLAGSYDTFEKLPEYLRSTNFTQDVVDGYIIGGYTSLSRPQGLLSGAVRALNDRLTGRTDEMRLQWMKDAKATTVDDVKASAEDWEALVQNGVRSTSGAESTLMANAELFDVLIYPDGTEKELTAAKAAA